MAHPETTVIRNGSVWTGVGTGVVAADLVIEDGTVAALESPYRGRLDLEIDASNCLVMPGFINAHVHPGASPLLRGLAEDRDLPSGGAFYHSTIPVRRYGFQILTADQQRDIVAWDVAAMLLGGATTIVNEAFGGYVDFVELVDRLGFRSSVGLTYPANIGAIGYVQEGRIVRDQPSDIDQDFVRALGLHSELNGSCGGRLTVHLSPHGSDTVREDILVATAEEAETRDMTVHLHLSQHEEENRTILKRTGRRPTEYLADLGFLGPRVAATHFTYTEEADWQMLASSGASMIHCSYRKAKEGLTSPLVEILSRGGNVALATDSFSHNLLEDLRMAAVLGKIRQRRVGSPTAVDVVRCLTAGGARALMRHDLGILAPGKRGDVTVVELNSPFSAPVLDHLRSAVYYGDSATVRHTLVNGRPVVMDGTLVGLDLQELAPRVAAACSQVWEGAMEEGLVTPQEEDTRGTER